MDKIVAISAGHNPDGKTACGAVGYFRESTQARKMVKMITNSLDDRGMYYSICTENNGKSQSDVLLRCVRKHNCVENKLCDIQIHFNSFRKSSPDRKITGCECLVRPNNKRSEKLGNKICKQLEKIGYTNRGVKTRTDLYFLNHTNADAVIVEVCFCDDADDYKLYKNNTELTACAIATAICKYAGVV